MATLYGEPILEIETHLTVRELIDLLSQRDPNEPVKIFTDVSAEFDMDCPDIYPEYPELDETSGLCYDPKTDWFIVRRKL